MFTQNIIYLMNGKDIRKRRYAHSAAKSAEIHQPMRSLMNKANKFERNPEVQQASVVNFQGDISRRIGNIRAVTLKNRTVNTDHIFGLSKFDKYEAEEKR